GVEALHHVHQVHQVVRVARVRMVVGEGAVDLAEQGFDRGADGFEHARPDLAGDAVAGIDHHLQRAVDLDVGGNALDVVIGDVALGDATGRRCRVQAVLGDARVQVGDRVAGQRLAADHDLEAVVVGRVVAAGHRHAAAGTQVIGAEIHHRRRHHADVDDVAARLAQAGGESGDHVGTGQAAV